jgi:ribosomal protein S18 acetylase RimI-like enzyme
MIHRDVKMTPGTGWSIRTIESPEEWEQALTMLWSVYVGENYSRPQRAEHSLSRSYLDGQGGFLIAVGSAGAVLGAVLMLDHQSPLRQIAREDESEFRLLGVDHRARGRGIGHGLVAECLRRARLAGTRAMVLSTQPTMLAAQRLYESLGFIRQPERDWETPDGDARWVYAVELDGEEPRS